MKGREGGRNLLMLKGHEEVLYTTRPVSQKIEMNFNLGITKLSQCSGIF